MCTLECMRPGECHDRAGFDSACFSLSSDEPALCHQICETDETASTRAAA